MKQKPYHLFLITAAILVLVSFFSDQDQALDVHLHDTYFIIAHAYVYWFLGILCLLLWVLYLLVNKLLFSVMLVWVQVLITILTLIVFTMLLYPYANIAGKPRRYFDTSTWNELDACESYTKATAVTIAVFVFGQIFFVTNFIAGMLKRKS